MKYLVFDTSTIISIATNDLLWVLKPLKDIFKGEFYIPDSVKFELVDKPFETKLFKLESIMLNKTLLDRNILVYEKLNIEELLNNVNNIYTVNWKNIHILDKGEVEALVLALRLQAEAYVVDERTMRLLIEDPYALQSLLEKKLHTKVEINNKLVKEFISIVRGIKVIRSTELLTIAFEKGLLNNYINSLSTNKELLDGLLWGLRLRGCSISTFEIDEIIKYESK